MQNKPAVEKYFFFVLLLVVLSLTTLIFWPFFSVLILGIAFAVVLQPVHTWIQKYITFGINWLAALLTVMFFLIVLVAPFLAIGSVIFNQSQNLYQTIVTGGGSGAFVETLNHSINALLPHGFTFDIQSKLADLAIFLTQNIGNIFTGTINTILSFFLLVLTLFYFLKDGREWKQALIRISPLSDEDDQKILVSMRRVINGVMKGSFFIALCQGVFMTLGLTLFGVPNPALFGLMAGIASFIPSVGTALVSIPLILYLLGTGQTNSAIGMTIWALFLVGTIDNVISPYVVGKNTEVPSLLILFAILGGISLLGPIGVLVGPLTISLLYVLVSIYRTEFQTK